MADIFDITGSRALVTGSTRGIGYAFVGALVRAGCVTVVHGRDPAATAEARDRLLADAHAGARVHTVSFDVTDADAVAAGVAAAQDAVGALDIVVNNAGVQHREPAATVPVADWRRVVDTNLTGAFLVSRAAAPSMMDRRRGKIVNVCSLMSELARPGITPYAAAKGGLKMLTRSLAAEWGPYGIQVNGIGPGYIETELTAPLRADVRFDAWVRGRTPAGRWGTVDDLTGTLRFLVSPAADYVNGQIVYVDGGMVATI